MKRILALLLALTMCLSLAACGVEAQPENKDSGIDLAAALESGKIPEIDITLGMNVEDVNVSEEHTHQDDSNEGYSLVEGEKYSYFLNQNAFAYYKNAKKSKGVSVVLSITGAFSLKCNNFVSADDVKAAFPNVKFEEAVVDKNDFTIMPYMLETTKKLTYKSGDRCAVFYIMEDQLIAVAIIDTKNWN